MTALLPVILAPPFAQSLQFRRPRPRPLKHSHTHTHTHTHAHTHTHTQAEGFDVRNENALEKLYLSSGNDIRHVINALQTWRMRTNEIKYEDVSGSPARRLLALLLSLCICAPTCLSSVGAPADHSQLISGARMRVYGVQGNRTRRERRERATDKPLRRCAPVVSQVRPPAHLARTCMRMPRAPSADVVP